MSPNEVAAFCIRYTVNDIIRQLDQQGIAPAPRHTAELLRRCAMLLNHLEGVKPEVDPAEDF